MIEALQYEFMRNALYAALLVSVACGVVGTLVVVKRIVFISGGITHAAFGGLGLGYLLGVNPILTALPFSLLAAIGISLVPKRVQISEDTTIGIFWAVGMAVGILFVGLAPGYAPDLFSYLFGSILTVPAIDLLIMAFLDVLIIVIVTLFLRQFQAVSFDEEYSQISGLPTRFLNALILSLVALSVIVLIRVVGIILIMALLTIPTAIARRFSNRLTTIMVISSIVAAFFSLIGLWLSYVFNLPSGATIVLTLAAAFGVVLIMRR